MDESDGATVCSDVYDEPNTPSTTKIHYSHEEDIEVDKEAEIESKEVEDDVEIQVDEECNEEQDDENQEAFAVEHDTPSTIKINNSHEEDIEVDKEAEIETEEVDDVVEEQVEEECNEEQDDENQEAFADDIQDIEEEEELPEIVDLPFMKQGFKWKDLMPKSFYQRKHAKKPDAVAPDLVESGTSVSIKHLRNRCKYVGTNPTKKADLDKASDFIQDLLKKMRINIQVIICKFFMAIATYLDFGVNEKSGIVENYDDFVDAVENVTCEEDSKKVLIICYLVFDFMKQWQKEVASIVCKRCNIVVIDKVKKETTARYDFVYKIVTYVTNQQRKNVNTYSAAAVGLRYTIMRWGIHLKKVKNKYDSRKQKCVYKWMIIEDKVSFVMNILYYNFI